jgi:hypothetical protein
MKNSLVLSTGTKLLFRKHDTGTCCDYQGESSVELALY